MRDRRHLRPPSNSAWTLTDTPLVEVRSASFRMGSNDAYPEEAPSHIRQVDGFFIGATPVTNLAFGRFVVATNYVTVAERRLPSSVSHGLDPTMRGPGSAVFVPPAESGEVPEGTWWAFVAGACWHAPQGPGTSIIDKPQHPVVHVALPDALAYCEWAKVRLPTEVEWEFAARSGLDSDTAFAWGSEVRPNGRIMANHWQGEFPSKPTMGNRGGTSAVGEFPPNQLGLYDMIGNVWEWTSTEFSDRHFPDACCGGTSPSDPLHQGGRTMTLKGGSHLCAENYCSRYRPSARIPQPEYYSASHIGFRVAIDFKQRS
ncbi:MAG: formylglycine-generating enzyme family protein [Actinomycetota bacterium]